MNIPASHVGGRKSVRNILAEACRFFKAAPYATSVIWRFESRLLLILAASTIFDGVSPVVSVWIMRYLLDAVVDAYQHHGQAEYVEKAIYLLVLQIVVAGGSYCINKIVSFFKAILSSKLSLDMQTDLIDGMSRLEMRDYDNPEIYNMITRAKGEAEMNKPLAIVSGLCNITSSLITWISFSALLFKLSPLVVVAMFAICIPFFILNVHFAKANFNLQYGQTHDRRVAGYLGSCFTNRRCLPEIITFDLWSFLRNKWNALATMRMRQDISLLKHRNVAELATIAITYIGRGGVSLYIIVKCLLHSADYTVGQIMMYFQSFAQGVSALAQVMLYFSDVYEDSCFLQTYQQFQEVQTASKPRAVAPRPVPEVIESIECRDVSFTYPGSPTHALHDVNLVFEKGQSTLLVGRNGAGKTTLARLLVGLYSPTCGRILINGYDMQEYDLGRLRRKMSIIFQDFVRYALTAEENIGVGSVEQIGNRQRIVNAAKSARLDDVIASLPKGYGTMLGMEFRDGRDLSLGEWQRIGLARFFMRNACVMVYDEPSASLDIETESELLREVGLSGRNGICILISHRMLRADVADRIVVVEKGRIVEQGDHDALVSLGGLYAHLWKTYHLLGDDAKLTEDCNAVNRR